MDRQSSNHATWLRSPFPFLASLDSNMGLVMMMVMVSLPLAFSFAESDVYVLAGVGICGGILLEFPVVTSIICAASCSHNTACTGFSFAFPFTGTHMCHLHNSFLEPDGQQDVICYLPSDLYDLHYPPGGIFTTTTTTTTTTTASAVGYTGPLADTSNTQKADIRSTNGVCGGNAGAIAIVEDGGTYYLVCKNAPNGYSYQAGNVPAPCTALDHMDCITNSCGTNSVIRGFMYNNGVISGPCTEQNSQTNLDMANCHTISGDQQDPGMSWTQWKICGGDASNYYVINAVSVTKGSGTSYTLDSITCCLVV